MTAIFSIPFHYRQIREGGIPVLLRKLRQLPIIPLSIPIVLFVRLLRPIVVIRFSRLTSDVIGLEAAAIEMYLCRRDIEGKRTFDIFYHHRKPCNLQLAKMWERILHVSRVGFTIDMVNHFIPGCKAHIVPWPEFTDADPEGLLPRSPIHLSFTEEEEERGHRELLAMGIPEGAEFVCFHSRDPAFKEVENPGTDHRYCWYRNSEIENHIPTAEEMTRRGYYAIRVGAVVEKPLETTNPMIIDYSTKYRSDFMDIYLCAKCYFYIGDEDGFNRVPSIFRRPLANLNVIPIDLIHTQGPQDLFMPKKLRFKGQIMTFRSIFEGGFSDLTTTRQYEEAGIEPIENTAEEILALAIEMDERLKGNWKETNKDRELQRRFWLIFNPNLRVKSRHGLIESRVGADFLRNNSELLGGE